MKKADVYILAIILLLISISVAGWLVFKQSKKTRRPDHEESKQVLIKAEPVSGFGKVIRYAGNSHGDIDKILIDQGKNKIWLHFPPHTARQVLGIASLHSKVFFTIHTLPTPGDQEQTEFEMVSVKSSESAPDLTIRDISPPRPKDGLEVEIKGNKTEFPEDNHSAEKSFILNGNLISVPPHMVNSLFPLLKNATKISVKGFERDSTDGFVKISGLPYIKPYAIKIDSITYLVR